MLADHRGHRRCSELGRRQQQQREGHRRKRADPQRITAQVVDATQGRRGDQRRRGVGWLSRQVSRRPTWHSRLAAGVRHGLAADQSNAIGISRAVSVCLRHSDGVQWHHAQ